MKTGLIIVGLSTSTHGGAAHSSDEKICTDPKKIPYDLLQIAVGCQCLIYKLRGETKPFRSFFKNPNLIAVGVDIASVAKKLDELQNIQISNMLDLADLDLAVNVVNGDVGLVARQGLARYGDDSMLEVVCLIHRYCYRPKICSSPWYSDPDPQAVGGRYFKLMRELSNLMVKFATLDAYRGYVIGEETLGRNSNRYKNALKAVKRMRQIEEERKVKMRNRLISRGKVKEKKKKKVKKRTERVGSGKNLRRGAMYRL
ncbi:hypothetical protein RHMOL_Rhmol03G0209200 [Rhododendron molle]|uniref:Uncharacterized protein n=1 Tax=Rhododendron molle TaxID=49168 RepID=A0ACC0PI38_RHOML|nr:hypothetical protein RHMOL_Rhmol03G0209200 [Rhododendron molle]